MAKSAKDLILESINRLNAKEAKARRKDVAEKLAYYFFDKPFFVTVIKQYIQRKETDIPYSFQNLTKKVINRKSLVYKKPPVRRFLGNADNAVYTDITRDKNQAFKVIERFTNLLGRIAVLVHWDMEKEKFQYNPILFFDITRERGEITRLIYEVDNELTEKQLFAVWTPEQHYISDIAGMAEKDQEAYGANPDYINPYGVIPFVYPYIQEPVGGFWVEGATDVVEANEKLNFSLTLLNYLERYSSFKQPYAKGEGLAVDELIAGYNRFLTLEGEGEVGVLDITAPLAQLIESIKFKIEIILHFQNISSRFGGRGEATSGFQLIVENIDLLDMWEDMVEIWRKHERDLFQIERIVYNVRTGKQLPEDMDVDFAEVEFPVQPEEQRQQDEWDLGHNLITELDIVKRRSPDTPEEELKMRLEKNRESNDLTRRPKPLPTLEERLGGLIP